MHFSLSSSLRRADVRTLYPAVRFASRHLDPSTPRPCTRGSVGHSHAGSGKWKNLETMSHLHCRRTHYQYCPFCQEERRRGGQKTDMSPPQEESRSSSSFGSSW